MPSIAFIKARRSTVPGAWRALAVAAAVVSGGNGVATAAVVGPAGGVSVDGIAPATVMQLNPSGIGHVNVVPYYTVVDGFDTYLNVVNTDTRNGKAVKVRFLSAPGGDAALNFTVLLGPGDAWAAALTLDAGGLPRLVHGDRSCTLPADVQRLFANAYADPADVRTGHIEVIAMADIPPRTADGDPPLFAAIRSVDRNLPTCAAAALAPLAADAVSYDDARAKGLDVPTTGLMSRWTLINVPRAVSYAGVATALEARVAAGGAGGYANVVHFPQTAAPLADLTALRRFTADPLLRGGVAIGVLHVGDQRLSAAPPLRNAFASDLPDLSTPYLPFLRSATLPPGAGPKLQVYATSKALSVMSYANEYVVDPAVQAVTDWVVTHPTARYSVAALPNYTYQSVSTNWEADDNGVPLANVEPLLPRPINYFAFSNFANGYFCTYVDLSSPTAPLARNAPLVNGARFDREGRVSIHSANQLVNLGGNYQLCGVASVLRVSSATDNSSVPRSALGQPKRLSSVLMNSDSGWMRIDARAASYIDGIYLSPPSGTPVIGFAAIGLFNAAARPGIAGYYGLTFPHSTTAPP